MVHETLVLTGALGLWVALLMSGWSAAVSLAGVATGRADLQTSGRRALYVTAVAALFAVCGLVNALVAHDFSLAFTARFANAGLSTPLAVSAIWATPAGALLSGTFVTAAVGGWVVASDPDPASIRAARLAGAVGMVVFIGMIVLAAFARPYARLGYVAAGGSGLDPMLRHVAASVGRAALVAAYAMGAVAVAVAAAEFRRGRARAAALRQIRLWVLAVWTLASFGIALSLRGAYRYSAVAGVWWPTPEMTAAGLFWLVATVMLHVAGGRGRHRPGRVGETVAHVGAGLAAAALMAGAFAPVQSVTVNAGVPVAVRDMFGREWQFVGQGVSVYRAGDHDVTAVSVEVSRGGRPATLLVARQLAYGDPDNSGATTPTPELAEPGVAHSLLGDLRIVTESTDGDAARVRVSLVPLVWMFWLGALLTVVGGAAGLVFEAGASPATEGA